jgi:hypothetical protein
MDLLFAKPSPSVRAAADFRATLKVAKSSWSKQGQDPDHPREGYWTPPTRLMSQKKPFSDRE